MTETTAANNLTQIQDYLNIKTSCISNYQVATDTQTLPTTFMSRIITSLDNFSRPYFNYNSKTFTQTLINKIRKI